MSDYCLDVDSVSKLYRIYKVQGNRLVRLWAKASARLRGKKAADRPAREVLALDEVSFKVRTGEALGIIGPNGAGKSTLLKILARVTFPTRGSVRGRGRVVPLLEVGTAFSRDLSARENAFLSGALFGIPEAVIRRRMDTILAWAELERFADVPVARLSSGMYVRLAFSVAVNLEPDILLADEILSVGDLKFRNRCEERIKELAGQGMTLLLVSHDMQAIRQIADRVLFLAQGRIVDQGAPEEMISAYEQHAVQQSRVRQVSRDESMARNDYAMIHQPEITSYDKHIKRVLSTNEDFWLKVPFDIYQAGLMYTVNADVYHRGIVIFGSRPAPFVAERTGLHACWIKVPGRLLTDDTYTVNLSIFCFDGSQWQSAKLHNAISISMIDPEDRFQKLREYGLPAPKHWVSDPRLEVEYEYLGHQIERAGVTQ